MRESASVRVILKIPDGVKIAAADSLEISLNWFVCRRNRRTIVSRSGEEAGRRAPSGHLFPAKIPARQTLDKIESVEINDEIEYWFAAFTGIKDKAPAEDILKRGRVGLQATRPKCGGGVKASDVQNNIVRPRTCYCAGGHPLYFETEEFSKFEKKAF